MSWTNNFPKLEFVFICLLIDKLTRLWWPKNDTFFYETLKFCKLCLLHWGLVIGPPDNETVSLLGRSIGPIMSTGSLYRAKWPYKEYGGLFIGSNGPITSTGVSLLGQMPWKQVHMCVLLIGPNSPITSTVSLLGLFGPITSTDECTLYWAVLVIGPTFWPDNEYVTGKLYRTCYRAKMTQ